MLLLFYCCFVSYCWLGLLLVGLLGVGRWFIASSVAIAYRFG